MVQRERTPLEQHQDRQQRRDGLIVDFSQNRIHRRDFMRGMTALGASVFAASQIADALAAPKPQREYRRWSGQNKTTITFIKGPHHPDDPKFWDAMKADFEKANPDIALNPTFFNWATMDAELTAGYASDSPPDVVYLVDLVLKKFIAAGAVADITAETSAEDFAKDKAGIAPFTWDVTKVDDKQYGVGALGALFNIYYNTDLFAAAGITAFPDTRDGLVEAAQKLTKDGVYGFAYRDTFPDYAHWDWMPYIHDDGADVLNADLSGQGLSPAAAAATQYLADMRVKYQVAPEAGAYDWNGLRALWEAGRVAILHDEAPQSVVWEAANLPFKWDIALAPKGSADKQTAMGNFGYATISEKSPNKDASWEFVKWWTSADVINPYAAKIGLQGVRIDSTPPYTSPMLTKVQSEFVPKMQGIQLHQNYMQMIQSLWPEVEKAYRGEQTGEQAMANAGTIVDGLVK